MTISHQYYPEIQIVTFSKSKMILKKIANMYKELSHNEPSTTYYTFNIETKAPSRSLGDKQNFEIMNLKITSE